MDDKKIDVEGTIKSILNHKMPFTSINEEKLREKANGNPSILEEIAEIVRVEVVYEKI